MRHLWLGAPAHNSVWGSVVWSLVIVAVFAPLAVWRYRRAANRQPPGGDRRALECRRQRRTTLG